MEGAGNDSLIAMTHSTPTFGIRLWCILTIVACASPIGQSDVVSNDEVMVSRQVVWFKSNCRPARNLP